MNKEELLTLRNEVQKFIRLFGVLNHNHVTPCGFHLSLSQVYALQELEKGTLTLNELSNRLLLERSSVSRLVDALVKSGFVTREQNENNRREVLLSLTDKGFNSVNRLRNQSVQFFETILSEVPITDQQMILKGFQAFTKSLERIKGVSHED